MNNEINNNTTNNQAPSTLQPQPVMQPQPVQVQPQPVVQQVQVQQPQQVPNQPLTLQQVIQNTYKAQQEKPPVDFNSLSPLEKEQLIEKAIKEAELKCKIERPKGFSKLTFVCIAMIALCVAGVIILNIMK